MLLKELLEKQEIKCPEWLSGEIIDDEWNNSTYTPGKEHTWTVQRRGTDCLISYDGTVCRFSCINPDTGELHTIQEQYKDFFWVS